MPLTQSDPLELPKKTVWWWGRRLRLRPGPKLKGFRVTSVAIPVQEVGTREVAFLEALVVTELPHIVKAVVVVEICKVGRFPHGQQPACVNELCYRSNGMCNCFSCYS